MNTIVISTFVIVISTAGRNLKLKLYQLIKIPHIRSE